MKTLLIEEPHDAFHNFIAGVRAATNSVIVHEESIPRGLQRFANAQDNIRIAVCTIDRDPGEAIDFVKQLHLVAHQAMVSPPRILILTRMPQPEWASDRLEKLGVEHLLRAFPDQVFAKLRLIRWQLRSRKSLPTLYVTRRHGHVATVGFLPSNPSADLLIGAKLRELVQYLGLHPNIEHTTTMLAEELDISRQSVKMYMLRLREAVDRLQRQGRIPFDGRAIAWTRRRPGGFVHGLRANIVFVEAEL